MALDANDFNGLFLEDKCNINLIDGLADPLDGNDQSYADVVPNSGDAEDPSSLITTLTVGSASISVNWGDLSAPPGAIVIQTGDTEGSKMTIAIGSVKTAALGIDNLSVTAAANARQAALSCNNAIDTVSRIRASLGADQNRLEHTMNNLSSTIENIQNAESRIRDVDMANEMSENIRNNILSQAGLFLLSQANQMPNNVLSLLQ